MIIQKNFLRLFASFGAGMLALLFMLFNFSTIVIAASVAQGYHSSRPVAVGAVVSLTKSGGNEVQLADSGNEAMLLGVAVDAKNAVVDVQPSGTDLRVAISGEVPVIVTNSNGDIKSGDNLVISNIAGVAMKDTSTSNAKKYIGVASENFSHTATSARQITIKVDGKEAKIYAGQIKVKLLLTDRQSNKPQVNPFVAVVQKLVGRPVGTAQVIGAVAVFITTFSFTGLLLNGSIKGAFVSIGRNPLSKPSIIANMVRVSAVGLLILIAGMAMAYVILLI